jgi:uncharacterized membrane protein
MIDNKLNIVFSDIATQKIAELSFKAQEKIDLFFQLGNLSHLLNDKQVKKLSNDFYIYRVDNDTRIIFTIENDKVLITDLANQSKEGNLYLPDPKTLEYYQKIDPTSVERILKLAEKEMEHRISLEKEILKREDYFEKIGLIFAIFLTVIGLIISTYLLFTTDKTAVSVIILLTTLLPTIWRLITKSKTRK